MTDVAQSRMKSRTENKKTIKPLGATTMSPDYNIFLVVCVQMFNLPYAPEITFEILAGVIATSKCDMLTWHSSSTARA